MGAEVRHATHSAVPSGLMQIQISVPNVETLGYYRPSLRDDEWQILVALDKHVHAPRSTLQKPYDPSPSGSSAAEISVVSASAVPGLASASLKEPNGLDSILSRY